MNIFRLIVSSLWFYRRGHLTVVLGMAIGMAVITGALVTGDSVRSGLLTLVGTRLGNVDLAVVAGDRFVTDPLAVRMAEDLAIPVTAVLQLDASASAGGGTKRLPKVQVYGVEQSFRDVLGPGAFDLPMKENEAIISDNLASRLGLKEGEEFLIRISRPGPVPIDAPFVSDDQNIITVRIKVKTIARKDQHGRFHLQNTQSAPFNVFINKNDLQKLTGLEGLSNLILMTGNRKVSRLQAERSLTNYLTLRDAGLNIQRHPVTSEWIIRTPRVFFDLPTLSAIESVPAEKSLLFSYFVNEFRTGQHTTPYSFVSTLPGNTIRPGEMMINRWLADDLGATPGDSVTISYFMVGPLRNLTTEKARFLVTGIIPMDDPLSDRLLMPEIPGLSDAGNCRDWETSIPVDLTKIRDKDEAYWNQYRGIPKAFINSGEAAALWQNRFGKYTQVRFSQQTDSAEIVRGILSHFSPSEIGILVREPAREGLAAASNGVDFSSLFLGLSFFLIAGGVILTLLLIRLGLEGRQSQIATLRATGWPEKKIRQSLLWENSLLSVVGAFVGLGLTFIYTILIFKALNGVWNDIVLTDMLRPVFKPATLAIGMIISIGVSVGSVWMALRQFFHRKTSDLLRGRKATDSGRKKHILSLSIAVTGLGALALLVFGLIRIQSVSPTFFFSAGTLMLLSLILLSIRLLDYRTSKLTGLSIGALGRTNIQRNRGRSLSVILLFSIGIFMVIAVGANRKTEDKGPGSQVHGGTGGFMFYAETTVPVADNLNNPQVRATYGLETPSQFVQMKILEGDDASCLNLNRVSAPPLLGVPSFGLNGRFRFASLKEKGYQDNPWKALEEELPGGAIPAVADQTVIQWGLGLKIGDTLKYKAETGDTVKLVLIGGLSNSIFQGKVLIAEKNFIRLWPSISGTNILLVTAYRADIEPVQSEILRIFRDYGTDIRLAGEKLAEFNSVENTYLSIFLVMGALAMLLGTIGLAMILARNLQERKAEIALLRAIGFSKGRTTWLVTLEYSALLAVGTLAGGLSALISVLPGLLNPAGEVSALFLVAILLILLANGFLWILFLAWNAARKEGIIQSLREE